MQSLPSNVGRAEYALDLAMRPPFACSIIIPVCQGGGKFATCLASVLSAVSPIDEIIVVADGEGDGSWRRAEEAGARIVKLPVSSGPARARNLGAEAATSEILFFVDADVAIPADAIERVRAAFQNDREVAALIGSYDEAPAELNFHSQYKNLFHHFVHQGGATEASTFWGACGAIRREVFLNAGGFDQSYERPCIEDIELGYRLRAGSHKIRLLPDLQVKHLKRWDARSLVRTDLLDRATPWTELILNHFVRRRAPIGGDLNLGLSYRLSLITSFLLIVASVGVIFTAWAFVLVILFGTAFVALNIPFFRFFRAKRGRRFAAHALAWRFGYDLYSGVGFCYGSLRFANTSTRRLLSEAFARIDPVALGAGVGVLWGGLICASTILLLLRGGEVIGSNLALLSQYFPGYTVTWVGSGVGFFYGAAAGFGFGFLFALTRNVAMKCHLGSRRMQRFLHRMREASV